MKKIIVSGIRIPVEQAYQADLSDLVVKKIRDIIKTSDFIYEGLAKKSIDARRKNQIYYQISANISIEESDRILKMPNVSFYKEIPTTKLSKGPKDISSPPIIVGAGPCGLFAAWLLAKNGYKPIVIERGEQVDKRYLSVKNFWVNHQLNRESNVQYGEGGAGAFSDGKLVTRTKDPRGKLVLDTLISFGANQNISYEAHPHIGTDQFRDIIKNMRTDIINNGGSFHFNEKVTNVSFVNKKVKSITVNEIDDISCEVVMFATGHSARDTYKMLLDQGIKMAQKPFSMGVRIEHLNKQITYAQYGKQQKFISNSATYQLNERIGQRTAYTFCMCPGGVVVNGASEENMSVTNGMSYSGRNGLNSNSAWVVSITPDDYENNHPLSGINLQQQLEKAAFSLSGNSYKLPVQRLGDFLTNKPTKAIGHIKPSATSGYTIGQVSKLLPKNIYDTLCKSAVVFNRRLPGFLDDDAIITGYETRTSSPVRILRDENFLAQSYEGLYVGGEGAGYAGGITSAAVDGLKLAEKIISTFNNKW